jgi:hypothetical protein
MKTLSPWHAATLLAKKNRPRPLFSFSSSKSRCEDERKMMEAAA